MIAKRSFGMTAIRRHAMTERPLRRDGFIWEVRRKLAMLDVLCERALDLNITSANARLAEESEPMKKTNFDHYLEDN
ncbi:MAG: hypothetical protein WBH61_08365 [Candidatus Methylomirabilis sp.]